MKTCAGMSRRVYLIGAYAIKVPRIANGLILFITGWLGNLLEHDRWAVSNDHPALAHIYYRAPLGLFIVMKRYTPLDRRLTQDELNTLPFINIDNNGANMAMESGRIVVLDYGGADMHFVKDM